LAVDDVVAKHLADLLRRGEAGHRARRLSQGDRQDVIAHETTLGRIRLDWGIAGLLNNLYDGAT
jgi:hypothetical protein